MEHILPFPGRRFPLAVHPMDPQDDMALHTHEAIELVLIRAGSGTHLAGHQRLPLGIGDVFVIPPGMRHGYAATRSLRLTNILFDATALGLPETRLARLAGYQALFAIEPQLRGRGFAGHLHLDERERRSVYQRVDAIAAELRGCEPGYELAATAALQSLIIELCRGYEARASGEAGDLLRLGELLAHIDRHLDEALSVERLAERALVSPATLQRRFREQLGRPVMRYVQDLRIERASELLARTRLPVAAVAARVGIPDPNYFSRLLRRHSGRSPRELRRAALDAG